MIRLTFLSVILSALMLVPFNSVAQIEPKHEISVSYGVYPASEFLDTFGKTIITLGILNSDIASSMGTINVSYVYKLNRVVALGATYTYSAYKENLFLLKTPMGTVHNSYNCIMPTAKFNWLNSNFVTLYSKVAAGVAFGTVSSDYTDQNNQKIDNSVTEADFGFQLTPFGIEVGRKFAIFAEVGIGNMGTAAFGARLRF